MQFCAMNCNNESIPLVFAQMRDGENSSKLNNDQLPWFRIETKGSRGLLSFEYFVGMEFSMVPEVESVFVESDKENGKAYHVISIINARDPEVRAKVYLREQAIMDEFPGVDFNFRVICRMNRNLSDVVNQVGTLAFQR